MHISNKKLFICLSQHFQTYLNLKFFSCLIAAEERVLCGTH